MEKYITSLDYKEENNLFSILTFFKNKLGDIPYQVLLGSLLGDMHSHKKGIKGHANISEGHSNKQKDYSFWKGNILKDFNIKYSIIKPSGFHKTDTFCFRSLVHPQLDYYYNLFYSTGRKTVTQEILNQLSPLGIAVWYCDDGCYYYSTKSIRLSTLGFTKKENEIIQKYFKEKWNFNTRLQKQAVRYGFSQQFHTGDTKQFLELIEKKIKKMSECVWYKLGGNLQKIEHAKEIQRNWQHNNPERMKKYKKRYRHKYPEREREYAKKYREKNIKRIRERDRHRYYKKKRIQ